VGQLVGDAVKSVNDTVKAVNDGVQSVDDGDLSTGDAKLPRVVRFSGDNVATADEPLQTQVGASLARLLLSSVFLVFCLILLSCDVLSSLHLQFQ
jgi:hypothetical protein